MGPIASCVTLLFIVVIFFFNLTQCLLRFTYNIVLQ